MKNIRDIGIVTKLVGINTILMLFVLSVISVFIFVHEKKQYLEELQRDGELIAEGLAFNAALPILTRNFELMGEMIRPVTGFEGVDHIAIYDKNKEVLSWFPDAPGLLGDESADPWPSSKMIQYLREDKGTLDTSIPVYMELIGPSGEGLGFAEDILLGKEGERDIVGYVHLAMSTSGLHRRVADFAVELILSVFALALTGIALITVVIRRFAEPVVELSRQAERIAGGELDLSVNVASRDEVGVLGESFNHMVDSLRAMINEVKERAAEVENLLEGAHEGIFIMDKSFVLVKTNREFAISLGYDRESLIGKSFFDLIEKPLAERLVPILSPADRPVIREVDIQTLSGKKISFEINFMPIAAAAKGGQLCFARDISERKMMEGQLLKAEKLAAAGRLAADIAHEVNNPLGIIKNYISILKKEMELGINQDEITLNVDIIGDEIDRIAEIVRGLLIFARPEPEGRSDTDINKVIRQVNKLVEGPLRKKDITVKLSLDENVRSVPVSEGHIKQVVINLLNNAEDAMSGGGLLFIGTSEVPGGVELVVEDEGVGIEDGREDQLLRPFYTTKGVKGTGLGLSVSYGIVKSYGGDLLLENRDEGGARARVFIPQKGEVFQNAGE